MNRRRFIGSTLTKGAIMGGAIGITDNQTAYAFQSNLHISPDKMRFARNVVVEHDTPGKPHKGKVLAAIQAHEDDIPIFAAGTVAKLIDEGYTGYLIRTTNEDKSGPGSVGDGVEAIEIDNNRMAKVLGCKKAYDLAYNKHDMDDISTQELRQRLIFLFRMLKVDTIITFDPWAHYEANFDHCVTARAVEAAGWHAPMSKDYPEQVSAGLEYHGPREQYYFTRNLNYCYQFTSVNCIVDISSYVHNKVESLLAGEYWGPTRKGTTPEQALARIEAYGDKEVGQMFGCEYAEYFFYRNHY